MAKKRYDEGGDVEVDTNEPGMKEAEPEENFKPTSFKEAFADARRAGEKTFMWKGKSFTTEVAGEKKAAPKAAPKAEAKKSDYETPFDRTNRQNREQGKDFDSLVGKLKNRITGASERHEGRKPLPLKSTKSESGYTGMGSTKMAKGGSASSRADGAAMRGKTRGRLI